MPPHICNRLLLLCLCLAAPSFSFAQISSQTPPPQDQPSAPLAPAYTLKAGTQLVIVDVIVKDKKGNKIHGLKQSDFIVKDGGKPQELRNFEEHLSLTPAELAKAPARPQLPPGEFTNLVTAPQNGALNVILVDANNTAVKDQAYMRTQLIDYLKHARPDSRTAIFLLTTHLVLLQGFTSDPAALLAAIEHKGNPRQQILRDNTSGGVQLAPTSGNFGNAVASGISGGGEALGGSALAVSFLNNMDALNQAYQSSIRAYTTLDGLNDLARFLVTIPGRKNLIWFSGDFPPEFFPSENSYEGPYAVTAALDNEFRDTVNLLSRAQVAVYPIDAQGLRTDQSNNASAANGAFAKGGRGLNRGGSPESVAHATEFALTSSEHSAMAQIAHDTGGEAFYNHNDLTRMVNEAIDDGSSYYTLTYSPSGGHSPDSFRGISVSVADEKYDLSYRRGYYTDRNHKIGRATLTATGASPNPLIQALQPGSPQPTQILLRAKATPVTPTPQAALADGNQPNPDPKKGHGPYRLYQVDFAASPQDMSFTHGADDIFHTELNFVSYIYDESGTLINAQSNTIRASYPKEKLIAAMKSGGVRFSQRISVPVKGDYFLRVAVHDGTSDRTGAVEIPVSSIENLPALTQAASSPSQTPTTP